MVWIGRLVVLLVVLLMVYAACILCDDGEKIFFWVLLNFSSCAFEARNAAFGLQSNLVT